jgi:hypothetical protein
MLPHTLAVKETEKCNHYLRHTLTCAGFMFILITLSQRGQLSIRRVAVKRASFYEVGPYTRTLA